MARYKTQPEIIVKLEDLNKELGKAGSPLQRRIKWASKNIKEDANIYGGRSDHLNSASNEIFSDQDLLTEYIEPARRPEDDEEFGEIPDRYTMEEKIILMYQDQDEYYWN